MNRTIKYRAWVQVDDDVPGKMIALPKNLLTSKIDKGRFTDYVLAFGMRGFWEGELSSEEFSFVVMQFTGLKDKHEKDIYEGDICAVNDHPNNDYTPTGIVEYNDEETQFEFRATHEGYIDDLQSWRVGEFGGKNLEIIGNIYENPELLLKHAL